MKLKITKENYCATIVQIGETYVLPNCDNVVGTQFYGNQVIVPKDTPTGEVGVYFPTGSRLSADYIKHNNLSRDPELNLDGEKKGYFEKTGRVKAVLFRKQESNGFFMPISSLQYLGVNVKEFKVGDQFNTVDGIEVVTKYVPVAGTGKASNAADSLEKMGVLDGQFDLHRDTKEFGKNIDYVTLDSIISVTVKFHGTSAVVGKVLAHNKLSFWEKIQRFFGKCYPKTKFIPIAASRGVIKNPLRKLNGFDLWCDNANRIVPHLYDLTNMGMLVYGEIVGYYPDGKLIQKGYDYKCGENQYDFYIYRVVRVTSTGQKIELDFYEIHKMFKNIAKIVPIRFEGKAIDLAREFGCEPTTNEELQQCLLNNLKKEIEILEPLCDNVVPREDYVVRIENNMTSRPAFKLRSFMFKKTRR
jgi:hypothetical protein